MGSFFLSIFIKSHKLVLAETQSHKDFISTRMKLIRWCETRI